MYGNLSFPTPIKTPYSLLLKLKKYMVDIETRINRNSNNNLFFF